MSPIEPKQSKAGGIAVPGRYTIATTTTTIDYIPLFVIPPRRILDDTPGRFINAPQVIPYPRHLTSPSPGNITEVGRPPRLGNTVEIVLDIDDELVIPMVLGAPELDMLLRILLVDLDRWR